MQMCCTNVGLPWVYYMQPAPVEESAIQQVHDLGHRLGALDANALKEIIDSGLRWIQRFFLQLSYRRNCDGLKSTKHQHSPNDIVRDEEYASCNI